MSTEPEGLSCAPAKFVDRVAQVDLILGKARKLTTAQFAEKRAVIFHGAHGSGKTWLLQQIEYRLKEELPDIVAIYLDMKKIDVDKKKIVPNSTTYGQVDLVKLRRVLVTSFNERELRDLCFDIRIDYEDLPGQTKGDKARELVAHCDRHEKINELIRVCCQLRPDLSRSIIETTQEALADNAARAVICQIRKAIEERTGPSPLRVGEDEKLVVLADALVSDVRRIGVLILLLDHMDKSPHNALSVLEARCLSPLLVSSQVLIVLAECGTDHLGNTQELREQSEKHDLPYFDLYWTQEQLKRLVPQLVPFANRIQLLTAGCPLLNYVLSAYPDFTPDALDKGIESLLDGLSISADVVEHLEALCVLRAFRDEMIPTMFAAYFEEPTYLSWNYTKCQEERQALTDTTLVERDKTTGDCLMHKALGHMLELRVYQRNRPTWERLHITARNLFEGWKSRYRVTAARWQREIEYHEGKLIHDPFWTPAPQQEIDLK